MINSILLPGAIIIAVSASLIVFIFTVLYVRINRKYSTLKLENDKLKKNSELAAQKILDEAHVHASQIIGNAQKEAEKIVSGAHSMTANVMKQENDAVATVIENVKEAGVSAIDDAKEEFAQEINENLGSFKAQMQDEFKDEYKKVALELEQYKKQKIEELSKESDAILTKVLTRALGEQIDKHTQEDLVRHALLAISHEYGSK